MSGTTVQKRIGDDGWVSVHVEDRKRLDDRGFVDELRAVAGRAIDMILDEHHFRDSFHQHDFSKIRFVNAHGEKDAFCADPTCRARESAAKIAALQSTVSAYSPSIAA